MTKENAYPLWGRNYRSKQLNLTVDRDLSLKDLWAHLQENLD